MSFGYHGHEPGVIQDASADGERKIVAILEILAESSEPLGSITIARELEKRGISLSERAVRYHLRTADERGYTQPAGRDGRMITQAGLDEIREALAPAHLGFIREKLETLAFQTTFDPRKKSGLLSINTSIVGKERVKDIIAVIKPVFKAKLAVSDLIAMASEGEKLGSVIVPPGKAGFGTVCSVVTNGVLLRGGVPTDYRFGGLLEVRNSMPRRFVAIIEYAGTSLDPSEQFIRARMTSVNDVVRSGSGKILGVFRTMPAPARNILEEKLEYLKEAGIHGVYAIGGTSESICQIPVGVNRIGVIQLGGLNPIAAAVEAGFEIESTAESGLIEYERLIRVSDL